MADRKAWREEKPRSRRHEDREREGSLLFSSPLKPITTQAPACFNSFEERRQTVGRLRPRMRCTRLLGQESARLDLQKPICRRPASTTKIGLERLPMAELIGVSFPSVRCWLDGSTTPERETGRIFGFFWSGKAIDQKGADRSG